MSGHTQFETVRFLFDCFLLFSGDGKLVHLKVIFNDESGQNLNLVIPKQYDGRSHVKLG